MKIVTLKRTDFRVDDSASMFEHVLHNLGIASDKWDGIDEVTLRVNSFDRSRQTDWPTITITSF